MTTTEAVEAAVPPTVYVTAREFACVEELLRDGATNKQIAKRLYISEDTVKSHVKKVLAKAGVANRTQFAVAVLNRKFKVGVCDHRDRLK